MKHDDAFLQAIIEAPNDDGPRLVYADWLDDHAQPERAEFIRVQCELARMPADDPRRVELEAVERRLLTEYDREWAGPWVNLAEKWEFRRGFVEVVTIPSNLLDQAEAVLRFGPVRHVKLLPRLIGPSDRALDLEPLGYEFDRASRDYDANWMVVRMEARDGRRQWSAVDAAFLTWELLDLAAWFRAIADAAPHVREMFGAIEPNLSFVVEGRGDAARVRAEFDAEFLPPQGEEATPCDFIEFQPGSAGLRRFADGLSLAMRPFPVRAVQADGPASRYITQRPA
jgi:uncharacterized protein (TIGR02996 family)